jgi:hypothetical protein
MQLINKKLQVFKFLIFPVIFIQCSSNNLKQNGCLREFDEKIRILSEFARGTNTHKIDDIVDSYGYLSKKTGKWGKLNTVSRVVLYDSLPVFLGDSLLWRQWYEENCK